MTSHPGLLKYDLAVRGARLAAGVAEHPDLRREPGDASVSRSLECVLPEEVWVSVPIDAARAARSPYELRADGDGFVIASDDSRSEVRLVPAPRFYGEATRAGTPMWRVGSTSGGALAINPAPVCAAAQRGLPCLFCEQLAQTPERTQPLSVADVIDTVRAAFAEGAVEFVYLHAGHHHGDDAGVEFLEPYVRAIKRHFDTLVAVQLEPPRTNGWIDRTYAMGVDGLSYSIALHDAERLASLRAGDAASPARTHEALRHAATVFPSGTVWSDLIVGLEPAASTIAGIDALVEAGVLPVLSLLRPVAGDPPPPAEEVAPLFAHLFNAVRKARINMNWVRDLSFAVTPLEARLFSDEGRATGLGTFYRSRLGSLAARNLSRLRRRLRVRQVSDSFDSSQL